jgi:hypothetical protein
MGPIMVVETEARTGTSRTGDGRKIASTGECLGYGREVKQGGRQRKRDEESYPLGRWLPLMDAFRTVPLQMQDLAAR